MIEQNATTGVIPPGCPHLRETPRVVPCIAAPDTSPDWPASWREAVENCGAALGAVLSELLLVRLQPDVRIVEVERR